MDLSPAQISGAMFRTIRKGYDPAEVDAFLEEVAIALESALQRATAMEARARAAVARLQEANADSDGLDDDAEAIAPTPSVPEIEAETISRTLLLAQHTADTTVADAKAKAEKIITDATAESEHTIDSTRELSAKMLEDAREEARREFEKQRVAAKGEVDSLVSRRQFLSSDVEQLERFLVDQRERLRDAARQIEAVCDRVPDGLGSVKGPSLSAADTSGGDATAEMSRPNGDGRSIDDDDLDADASDDDDLDAVADDHDDADDATAGHDDGDGDASDDVAARNRARN